MCWSRPLTGSDYFYYYYYVFDKIIERIPAEKYNFSLDPVCLLLARTQYDEVNRVRVEISPKLSFK